MKGTSTRGRVAGDARRTPRRLAALLVLLALGACATTRIVEKWRDPAFSGPLRFNKVVVLVISPDATVQRVAEDELVRQLGARAVAAYTILDEEVRRTPEGVLAALDRNQADGLVVMRLVDTKQETTYVPGPIEPFPSYYRMGYGYAYDGYYGYDTGYVTTRTHLRVETRIYSVGEQRLLWTGITDTLDPKDLRRLVASIADAVADELRKEGLLEPRETER